MNMTMSESNEQEPKKPLSLARPGRLELKKTVDAGHVRQSFPHGRSKTVQVEVKRKRTYAPGAGGRMTEVVVAPEGSEQAFGISAADLLAAEHAARQPEQVEAAPQQQRFDPLGEIGRHDDAPSRGLGEQVLGPGRGHYIPPRRQPQTATGQPALEVGHQLVTRPHHEAQQRRLVPLLARGQAAAPRLRRRPPPRRGRPGLRRHRAFDRHDVHASGPGRRGVFAGRRRGRCGRGRRLALEPVGARRHDDGVGVGLAQLVLAQDA